MSFDLQPGWRHWCLGMAHSFHLWTWSQRFFAGDLVSMPFFLWCKSGGDSGRATTIAVTGTRDNTLSVLVQIT
jgi:hypothetical protein